MALFDHGDRRQLEVLPWPVLAQHVTDEIVLMQPLHDDDGAGTLVVQAGVERVAESLVHGHPLRVREGLLRLERAVDDENSNSLFSCQGISRLCACPAEGFRAEAYRSRPRFWAVCMLLPCGTGNCQNGDRLAVTGSTARF